MPRLKIEDRVNLPYELKRRIEAESHGRCAHCGGHISRSDGTMTIEHVIPLHKGGTNEPDNLVALCKACNKEKGNDVVHPSEYYPMLPAARRKALSRYFEKWLGSVDCMAYDTLFVLDRFTLTCQWMTQLLAKDGNVRSRTFATRSFRVEKLRDEAASELLMPYAARLSYADKLMFEFEPDRMFLPYYSVIIGGKHHILVCPHIVDSTKEELEDGTEYLSTYIAVDIMPDPDISLDSDQNLYNMSHVVDALVEEVARSMSRFHAGHAMELRIRTPGTDRNGATILSTFPSQGKRKWTAYENSDPDGSRTFYVETVLFAGSSLDQQALAEKLHGTRSLKTLVENTGVADIADVQEAIMADVRKSKPIREKPGHVKKRDKKRKHKKR